MCNNQKSMIIYYCAVMERRAWLVANRNANGCVADIMLVCLLSSQYRPLCSNADHSSVLHSALGSPSKLPLLM